MVGSHSSSEVREDLLALSPAQAPGGTAPVRPAAGRGRHFAWWAPHARIGVLGVA